MKFECLINLLEEKELVKIRRRKYDGICISVTIHSEYREVLDKIINSLPNYADYNDNGDRITIMTVQDVYNWVRQQMKSKGEPIIYFKLEHYFLYEERELFKAIVKRIDDFEYEYQPWVSKTVKLTDVEWLAQIKEEEEKKHQEVVDFLNSLP